MHNARDCVSGHVSPKSTLTRFEEKRGNLCGDAKPRRRWKTFTVMEESHYEKNGLTMSKRNLIEKSYTVVRQTPAECTLFALLIGFTFPTWLMQTRSYMWSSVYCMDFAIDAIH